MSAERQTEIMAALEAIPPAEAEPTLFRDGIDVIIKILQCSREMAVECLARLRGDKKIKIVLVKAGGIPDERKQIQENRFRWSR